MGRKESLPNLNSQELKKYAGLVLDKSEFRKLIKEFIGDNSGSFNVMEFQYGEDSERPYNSAITLTWNIPEETITIEDRLIGHSLERKVEIFCTPEGRINVKGSRFRGSTTLSLWEWPGRKENQKKAFDKAIGHPQVTEKYEVLI